MPIMQNVSFQDDYKLVERLKADAKKLTGGNFSQHVVNIITEHYKRQDEKGEKQ